LGDAKWTTWEKVAGDTDFTYQFRLTGLAPGVRYYLVVEGRGADGSSNKSPVGSFQTAPAVDQWDDVWFAIVTCQLYYQRDDRDGFKIYRSMQNLSPIFLDQPRFLASTGDSVYYDRDNPRGLTVDLARLHWQRMYSLPMLRDFFRNVPGYWEKDDHDTFFDDSYAELRAPWIEPLTWEQGVQLFREQTPNPEKPYRTIRWGTGVQIWLTENREYRSSDEAPDGPEKTIWGKEQKEWLKRTLLESDATFKILISPTAIVGPDNPDQSDNHANTSFKSEGSEFRNWARDNGLTNLFVFAGDRHWQYASIDPLTGIHEFACGPASDGSVLKGPGYEPNYHAFYRAGGGFITVSAKRGIKRVLANPQRIVVEDGAPILCIRIHDTDGKIVYEYRYTGRMN
jgi:alkaline phosphatase D